MQTVCPPLRQARAAYAMQKAWDTHDSPAVPVLS